jgi:hypothetical protein
MLIILKGNVVIIYLYRATTARTNIFVNLSSATQETEITVFWSFLSDLTEPQHGFDSQGPEHSTSSYNIDSATSLLSVFSCFQVYKSHKKINK